MQNPEQRVEKTIVARHFGRQAHAYDDATPVQAAMGEALLQQARREFPAAPRRILELGCGTGRLTAAMAQLWPGARIVAVDLAPQMCTRTRARLATHAGLSCVLGDADDPAAPFWQWGPYDLIIAGATVQWLPDPPARVAQWPEHLRPGGVLALSTFGPGTFRELRLALREAATAVGEVPAERLLVLPDAGAWQAALPTARVRAYEEVQYHRDVHSFLRAQRRSGATHAGPQPAPMSRRLYRQLQRCYAARFGGPRGVPVTWEIIDVLLRRPAAPSDRAEIHPH